ncbi:MAG: hypothetical protein ACD_62C00518G0001, partial [uncultured bacterium]
MARFSVRHSFWYGASVILFIFIISACSGSSPTATTDDDEADPDDTIPGGLVAPEDLTYLGAFR